MSNDVGASGFHTYSSYNFVNFTDKNLRDISKILTNFNTAPDAVAFTKLIDELQAHRRATNVHLLKISGYSDVFIKDLYTAYRDHGHVGDLRDMFDTIYKDIDVGSVAECLGGWSISKAVPVPGWLAMFDRHEMKANAHPDLMSQIIPDDLPNLVPVSHITPLISDPVELGVKIPYVGWSDRGGTICVDLRHDLSLDDHIDILTLSSDTDDITLSMYVVDDQPYIRLTSGNVECRMQIPYESGMERLVIAYDKRSMTFRDMLNGIKFDSLFSSKITHITFHSPVTSHPPSDSQPCSIVGWWHYNTILTSEQQVSFINS